MWRRTDDRRVWYEWLVDVYVYVTSSSSDSMAGQQGRNSTSARNKMRVGGSVLHSSEKDACLM